MKKLSWLMMLMTAMTLSLVGCGEDPVEPTPQPGPNPPAPEPTELTFDVEITDVTKARMFFDVTPSNNEAEYLCMVYEADFVDSYSKDEYLVGEIFNQVSEEAANEGLVLGEYLTNIADKGAVKDGSFSGLVVDTNYYLLVFGYEFDEENEEYVLNGSLVREAFTTEPAPQLNVTFDVTTSVEKNTVTFSVVPSDKEVFWHLISCEKAMTDQYMTEGGMSLQAFYMQYVQQEIDAYAKRGYPADKIMEAIFLKGDLELTAKGLNAYTEYDYLIAGFVVDEDGIYIATDVDRDDYTTQEPMYTGMTFDITVENVTTARADIKIVPSDLTQNFFWIVNTYDGVSTADEVAQSIINEWGMWMSIMCKYSGVQDYTAAGPNYKFRLDTDNQEYCVIAFGYANALTTEPTMVTFQTVQGVEAIDAQFELEVVDITSDGAKLKVTAEDESVQYMPNVVVASEFKDPETMLEELNADLKVMYQEIVMGNQESGMPVPSYPEILNQYYYRGNQVLSANGLTSNTEYKPYIMVFDDKTFEVAKILEYDTFTTPGEGNINPTLSLKGIFSGDEENGQIWTDDDGNPVANGYAIAVIKIENYSGAKSLYFSSIDQDYTYEASYSDEYLMANLGWSANTADGTPYTEAPYIFTLLSWNVDYSFFAYAVDENGGAGKVGRLAVKPLAKDKQPIDKLIELYEEANSSASAYVPGSLVIENGGVNIPVPTITCIDEPKVEKQRKAVVEEVVEPGLIILDYVTPYLLRD